MVSVKAYFDEGHLLAKKVNDEQERQGALYDVICRTKSQIL